jgi:hypothetical protein
MGTESLMEEKRPGLRADHTTFICAKVVNGMELYLRLPCMPTKAGHGVTTINDWGYTVQKYIISNHSSYCY